LEMSVPFPKERREAMKERIIIEAQQGAGFELRKGDRLKIIDPEGEQVADLFCYSKKDPRDALSSGRSIAYNETLLFSKGDLLYAQSGTPMLEIIEDTCARHDFLVTPCSLQMFQMMSGKKHYHRSCLENLEHAFAESNVDLAQIGTTFNVFMNVTFESNGKIKVAAPLSKAGDHLIVEAKMDLIVGLTACSDEGSNNGKCKAIEYEILKVRH
jgi:uncharacterized protein YcgI (DUF1989 family)